MTYSSTCKKPVRPKRIRFGLLSPEEIRRVAVVRVHDTTLYYRGLPNSGGLLDPLMGSVDRRHLCASCMRDARTCQGHIGYIELAYPMYHTGFIETVLKVLRTTCFMCSRLCATETDLAAIASLSGTGDESGDPAKQEEAMKGFMDAMAQGQKGMQEMMDTMLQQLLSKDVLYEPMVEIAAMYPPWIKKNKKKLPDEEIVRYEAQLAKVRSIVEEFEKPEGETQFQTVVTLLQEMQSFEYLAREHRP